MKEKIKALERRIEKLEKDSHPAREFVNCQKCKEKIKEA